MENERDAACRLEEIHLVPETALAQHLAVVGQHDDDGVIRVPGRPQHAEQVADVVVYIRQSAIVGVPCGANVRLGHVLKMHPADVL